MSDPFHTEALRRTSQPPLLPSVDRPSPRSHSTAPYEPGPFTGSALIPARSYAPPGGSGQRMDSSRGKSWPDPMRSSHNPQLQSSPNPGPENGGPVQEPVTGGPEQDPSSEHAGQSGKRYKKKKKRDRNRKHDDQTGYDSTGTYVLDTQSGRKDSRAGRQDSHREPETGRAPRGGASPRKYAKVIIDKKTVQHNLDRRRYGTSVETNKLSSFMKDSIKNYECNTYVESSDKTRKRGVLTCCCGLERHEHREASFHKEITEWSQPTCISPIPCVSFGEVIFSGFRADDKYQAPYVRVGYNTSSETVWKLLYDHWDLQAPGLVISVTGGAQDFNISPKITNSFKKGLIDVATSTGAWIITGGLGAGVMNLVGSAVSDYLQQAGSAERHKLVTLGIAAWGGVDNNEALEADSQDPEKAMAGCFPTHYRYSDLEPGQGKAALQANHSHFILVDNGTHRTWGAEVKWRAQFEEYIGQSLCTGVDIKQSVSVPVVVLVIKGGPKTLLYILECVKKRLPVVIFRDTQGASDVLTDALQQTTDRLTDKMTIPENLDDLLTLALKRHMPKQTKQKDRKVFDEMFTVVKEIVTTEAYRPYLSVFDHAYHGLDHHILVALINADTNVEHQLKLALTWDAADFARQNVFTKHTASNEFMKEILFTALVQNQPEFVQLFLDNGVDLGEFLTVKRLRECYDEVINTSDAERAGEFIRYLVESQKSFIPRCCQKTTIEQDQPRLLYHVGTLLRTLIGEFYTNDYKDDKFVVKSDDVVYKLSQLIERSIKDLRQPVLEADDTHPSSAADDTRQSRARSRRKKVDPEVSDPEKHLFLWAILLNRMEMATLFWKASQDHIGGALIGSAILKRLAKYASGDEWGDLNDCYEENSSIFELHAQEILGECDGRNKRLASSLLVRKLDFWGGTTVLNLAEGADMEDFMNHHACQVKLNRLWKGNMALHTGGTKIVAGALFPITFFAVPFVKFVRRHDREARSDESGSSSAKTANLHSDHQLGCCPVKWGQGRDSPEEEARSYDESSHEVVDHHTNVYTVGLTSRGRETISYLTALYYYWNAPATKFIYHLVSYIFFLALFSSFVMSDLHPVDGVSSPSALEYVTYLWVFSLMADELRQILERASSSKKRKIISWFNDGWNKLDFTMFTLFIVTVIIRWSIRDSDFVYCRYAYAITLTVFYARITQKFYVFKNIGPKIIMIGRMIKDLFFFLFVLIIFLTAYGVANQAVLYPNSPTSIDQFVGVLYKPYWQMYGDLFLDEQDHADVPGCWSNITELRTSSGIRRCPEQNLLSPIFLAVYMILTNVLLLNLLIAMFSYTFEAVEENSEKLWRFNRCSLIHEYFERPSLFPPFSLILLIIRAVRFVYNQVSEQEQQSNDFKELLDKSSNRRISALERHSMEAYITQAALLSKQNIDNRVKSTAERIEKVIDDLDDIKHQVQAPSVVSEETALPVAKQQGNEVAVMSQMKEDFEKLQQAFSVQAVKMDDQSRKLDALLSHLASSSHGSTAGTLM